MVAVHWPVEGRQNHEWGQSPVWDRVSLLDPTYEKRSHHSHFLARYLDIALRSRRLGSAELASHKKVDGKDVSIIRVFAASRSQAVEEVVTQAVGALGSGSEMRFLGPTLQPVRESSSSRGRYLQLMALKVVRRLERPVLVSRVLSRAERHALLSFSAELRSLSHGLEGSGKGCWTGDSVENGVAASVPLGAETGAAIWQVLRATDLALFPPLLVHPSSMQHLSDSPVVVHAVSSVDELVEQLSQ